MPIETEPKGAGPTRDREPRFVVPAAQLQPTGRAQLKLEREGVRYDVQPESSCEMTTGITRVVVAGTDRALLEAAQTAVQRAFPRSECKVVASLDEAGNATGKPAHDLLVLLNPREPDIQKALGARDELEECIWAIVVLGEASPQEGVDVISPGEASPSELARVLRGAAREHALRRENARLRGDLWSIARRINHDLKSPLGAIFASADALDDTEDSLIKTVIGSAGEMEKIIDQVSAIGKATARPKAKEPVDTGAIVTLIWEKFQLAPAVEGTTLAQPDAWPEVNGVPKWVETIWLNLLSNALKHGGPRAQIKVGWKEDGSDYQFWVSDSGKGVPEEQRETLFQPFYLLHLLNGGPGLGLTTVERLVELQGGRCGYEHLTEGPKFYFTLPRNGI